MLCVSCVVGGERKRIGRRGGGKEKEEETERRATVKVKTPIVMWVNKGVCIYIHIYICVCVCVFLRITPESDMYKSKTNNSVLRNCQVSKNIINMYTYNKMKNESFLNLICYLVFAYHQRNFIP